MTLAEAVKTIIRHCEERDCENCIFEQVDDYDGWRSCQFVREPVYWMVPAETNVYDEVEEHKNCTVQILKNSLTGEESVGWWENEEKEE